MRRGQKVRGAFVVGTVIAMSAAVALSAWAQPKHEPDDARGPAEPTIRWTEYGIPHITASTFEGLGEGYGYAVAKDNLCVLADTYLTVDAERSRYLGPDGRASIGTTGTASNLDSDFYFQRLQDDQVVEKLLELEPPKGVRPEVEDAVRGYVEGYNRYLTETGVDNITDPACKGAEWVRPISEIDVYRHVHATTTMGSAQYVLEGQANAAPMAVRADSPEARPARDVATKIAEAMRAGSQIGSNALAVGSEGVSDGTSMLLGNPHFPWSGKNRLWQSHLTIPGKFDAAGATLLGFPGINIGHNHDVAWSHTVSTVAPFGLFDVQVDPLNPTRYLVDGKWEDMTSQKVSVDVRDENGSIEQVQRTLWSTRYGPITTSIAGIPLPWVVSAHAVRDANMDNLRALNTWLGLGATRSTGEIVDVLERTQGIPWVNTLAVDRTGNALFADIQAVPNITDEHAENCLTATGRLLFGGTLMPQPLSILDGKRSECDWPDDPDAVAPGLLSPKAQPRLTRADYVGNANDSPWLSNPDHPLTYPRVMGNTGTARSLRTQELIRTARARLDGTDGLQGKGFYAGSMRELLFADHSRAAELALADTVRMCTGFAGGLAPYNGGLIDVSRACDVLEAWDGTYTHESRGSLLFQKFWDNIGLGTGLVGPWKDDVDLADPVNTPNQLATGRPDVWLAFGNAVAALDAAGIPLDAPLSEHQSVTRAGERLAIHGSRGSLGVLNVIEPVWDDKGGNVDVVFGSSFIQEVRFTAEGPPRVATLLTYSQSSDPTSPHHADQTKLFSEGRWVTERFTEDQIAASPELKVKVLD